MHRSALLALVLLPSLSCTGVKADPVAQANCGSFTSIGDAPSCNTLCQVSNPEFCAATAVDNDCDKDLDQKDLIDVCGVSINAPPLDGEDVLELARSTDVKEFGGTGSPDLSCLEPAGYPAKADPGASQDVTIEGIAKIFSNGCESKDLSIEIYRVIRDGSADDGKHEANAIASTTTPMECTAENSEPEEIEECEIRYECRYEISGIPSETELMVKTDGALWAPLYEYGLFIPNSEVVGGKFEKDVRALDQTDYSTIAQAALGKTITPGNGAIAGEVHDCGDVRLLNAVVDVDRPKFALTYFTDNEDDPLPNLSAKGTTTLSLYSALDIEEGPITVAAAGVKDGALYGLGIFRARIYPDAVTSFTFRGVRAFQVP